QLIPISRAYKRATQKGPPDRRIYQAVKIGSVVCGGDELVVISGPCSVESEPQIMKGAQLVKETGRQCLRGGVVKYRSNPYSGWEGLGSTDTESLKRGLALIVKAGRKFKLPTMVEILDPANVSIYKDANVDYIQIKKPNSKN